MTRGILSIIFFLAIIHFCDAQQLAAWSSFHETGFVWNPAMTARYTQWELSGTHRQEWLGFDDAPQVTTLSFQMPFYQRKFTSSAGGAYLERDQVGPFDNYSFGLSYAYKFSPRFQKRGINDELSIGFSLKGSRYLFTPNRLTLFNPNEYSSLTSLDPNYQNIVPNLSFGVFYSSRNTTQNYNKSFYFSGIAVNQLAPLKALSIKLADSGNSLDIRLQPHILTNVGYRYYPFRAKAFIETNVLGMYSLTKSMHAMVSSRYEIENKWWLSVGGVTNGEFFVQTGVIFDNKSALKKIVNDGQLRIGVKGDFNAGSLKVFNRTGYELYMAYVFETDN